MYRLHPSHCFIQFLNPEITDLYGVPGRIKPQTFYRKVVQLCRYSVLLSRKGLVFPQSYFAEVECFRQLLRNLGPVIDAGLVFSVGQSANLREFFAKKRLEYRDELTLFPNYEADVETVSDPDGVLWMPRIKRSSSRDLAFAWQYELERSDGMWMRILKQNSGARYRSPTLLESAIAAVPQALDGRAFIYRFAAPYLPVTPEIEEETQVKLFLSRVYLESYLDECDAFILTGTPLGDLDCQIDPVNEHGELRCISWRGISDFFSAVGLQGLIDSGLTWPELLALRTDPGLQHVVTALILEQQTGGGISTLTQLREAGALHDLPLPSHSPSALIAAHEIIARISAALQQTVPFVDGTSEPIDLLSRLRRERAKLTSATAVQYTFQENMNHIDLAIIVALREEFELLHLALGEPKGNADSQTGAYHYQFERQVGDGKILRGVAVLAGHIGLTKAAIITTVVNERYSPKLVVNIGIAGALSDDVCVGDVVVASVVDLYRENAREESERWVPAGEPYRTSKEFLEIANNLEFSHANEWQSWLSAANRRSEPVVNRALVAANRTVEWRGKVIVHVGHVASGPSVGAAAEFKQQLLARDRSYAALEMESGAVAAAVYERVHPIRSLIIKGISDFADDRKKVVDQSCKGELRRAAMESALALLWVLLSLDESARLD